MGHRIRRRIHLKAALYALCILLIAIQLTAGICITRIIWNICKKNRSYSGAIFALAGIAPVTAMAAAYFMGVFNEKEAGGVH